MSRPVPINNQFEYWIFLPQMPPAFLTLTRMQYSAYLILVGGWLPDSDKRIFIYICLSGIWPFKSILPMRLKTFANVNVTSLSGSFRSMSTFL